MSPARAQTQTTRSEDNGINYEATAPLTADKEGKKMQNDQQGA